MSTAQQEQQIPRSARNDNEREPKSPFDRLVIPWIFAAAEDGRRGGRAQYLGHRGETTFTLRALEHGLIVSQPLVPAPYDFVVQPRPRRTSRRASLRPRPIWRIQVKTGTRKPNGGHHISTQCHGLPYTLAEIDFFAAWASDADVWYIIPARAVIPSKSAWLWPDGSRSRGKYEKFREAWQLLGARS